VLYCDALRKSFLLCLLATPLLSYAQGPSFAGCPVFPANAVWNTRIDQLPVDPNSDTYVAELGASSPTHPDFGSDPYASFPVNVVHGNSTPPANVTVDWTWTSDPGPYPIPTNAVVSSGGDNHLIVVDVDNCKLYEAWEAIENADGSWNITTISTFDMRSNQAKPWYWASANAAGTPQLPLLIRYDEVAAGHIDHAISMDGAVTANWAVWPAVHWAPSGINAPPMGTRFRLKANFDTSGFSRTNQIILQAMKTYGLILTDNGASWHIQGVPDPRWNDDDLHALTQIPGSAYEAVDESSLMISPDSWAANQPGTPASASSSLPSGWVNIISKNSGKCLDIMGGPGATWPGDLAQQWDCWNGYNQQFQFTPVNGGYEITARHSGLQLDIEGGPSAVQDGVLLLQWPYWGGSNEIFSVNPTGDGYYTITVLSSGKCLDVSGMSVDNGALVHQWTCWGGDNQKWQIVPAQ
jgi:hypothetical protein